MYTRLFFVLTIFATPELLSQTNTEPTTRADQIRQQRLEKDTNGQTDKPSSIEKHLTQIGRMIGRIPIHIQVGGLGPGAGIAVGSVLEWNSSAETVLSKLWGITSFHGFYRAGAGLEIRNFTAHDLSFAIEGSHTDAPQLEYYGSGPQSSIHNRTNFRREDTLFEFRMQLHAPRRLAEACRVGQLLLNVGPGTNGSLASSETVFGPDQAPGIDVQSNYVIAGCATAVDVRDVPENPHKGTYAAATYDRYFAQNHDGFSFHRLSAVAEQYVPFFNKKRVIAIRAKTNLSLHSGDQAVPFYLQPTLGSDTDLRGFRRYRFYDENSIALTAEYRWEISTGFDMALFGDSGKVSHRPGEISLSGLESSVGFGFRFKNPTRVVARLDTGFSREGFQIWFTFGEPF